MNIDSLPEIAPRSSGGGNIFAHIARYTRFVMFTKLGLVSLLALFLGYVFYKANSKDTIGRYNIIFSGEKDNASSPDSEMTKMLKPKYQGIDDKGRAYNISGNSAQQLDKNVVMINKLQGDITLEDGSWLSVNSDSGKIEINNKQVILGSNSSVFHDSGYEFHSHDIKLDINNKTAESQDRVTGNEAFGNIVADSFFLDAAKSSIKFSGNVKLVVYANAK